MKAFIWRYVPYLVAAFMVANGFYTLAMGLGEIFHLDQYLAVELGEMRRYLEVVPAPQLGGFVAVCLGVVFIVLGKGLAERRRRARNWGRGGAAAQRFVSSIPGAAIAELYPVGSGLGASGAIAL